ncbi:hypothetical protein FACS189481_5630 [Clostridia bacterium]|nr:hypothetical protein FACS189481_5630 [Clostridia bacterium]
MRKVNEKMRGKRKKRSLASLLAMVVCVTACMPVSTGSKLTAEELEAKGMKETTNSPIDFSIAPVTLSETVVRFTTPTTETAEEEAAGMKEMVDELGTINMDTDLHSEHAILTKFKKKNPGLIHEGVDAKIIVFGANEKWILPNTYHGYLDKILEMLGRNLFYDRFEVTSAGTIVEKTLGLKMDKGKASYKIDTTKNSFVFVQIPIIIRKNGKYQATKLKSFETTMPKFKKAIKGSDRVTLNSNDTLVDLNSSDILASKATGTVDLEVRALTPEDYGQSSQTMMLFDLGDLGKLESDVTLYRDDASLKGKKVAVCAVNSEGKVVKIGDRTVSKKTEVMKIVIPADVAKVIGKAKT